MDLSGIPPPVMNWDASNLPEEWQKFKLHIELIFSGPLNSKTEEEQVSYLLLWIGQPGRKIYKTWSDISADDAKKPEMFQKPCSATTQPYLCEISF